MHPEGGHELVQFCFDGSMIENVGGHRLDVLILLIQGDDLCRRTWLEAVQPVEELYKHFQGYRLQRTLSPTRPRGIPEQDGVVKTEHMGVFERLRDHTLRAVQRDESPNTGVHDSNVIDESFGEEGG